MTHVIVQAGGKGTRLEPYTTVLPKPLMPIDEFPALEIVIRQLVHYGFRRITITVGHLGHLIMAVIGDGSRWGAKVEYLWEEEPRGTIGAVSQLRNRDESIVVMNGDLLTDFNYARFWADHKASGCSLSVGVYYKPMPVSLGVLELDHNNLVTGFREKPVLSFPCSMGIYAFEPDVLRLIPDRGVFGFDDLMAICLDRDVPVCGHRFNGLWLDIGRPEDYAAATQLFWEHRDRLLPSADNVEPLAVRPTNGGVRQNELLTTAGT